MDDHECMNQLADLPGSAAPPPSPVLLVDPPSGPNHRTVSLFSPRPPDDQALGQAAVPCPTTVLWPPGPAPPRVKSAPRPRRPSASLPPAQAARSPASAPPGPRRRPARGSSRTFARPLVLPAAPPSSPQTPHPGSGIRSPQKGGGSGPSYVPPGPPGHRQRARATLVRTTSLFSAEPRSGA
ncbi:uncharacterized protein LOC119234782 [Talpa occidentalis]|uniref:uncharacterized protein LOC119234782 n=1 Tax=Talpa occidentalis TaxID=50954 RepID=UPI00188E609F|nr:uncharacterized protein LOC119234782 [Talpa occidentalis]